MSDTQIEQEIQAAPETVEAVPAAECISDLQEDVQRRVLLEIEGTIAKGYATENYVRAIEVHPKDIEMVTAFVDNIDGMPPTVRQLIQIFPNHGQLEPSIIHQLQVERDWLNRHFKDVGLVDWITSKGAPIMLTHSDRKLLFLLEGLMECKAQSRILRPGGAPGLL